MQRIKSIRGKITAITISVSVVVLMLVGFGMYLYEIKTFIHDKESDIQRQALVIANNISAAVAFNDEKAATDIISVLKSDEDIVEAAVILQNGKVLASFTTTPQSSEILKKNASIFGADTHFEFKKNSEGFVLREPILLDHDTVGELSMYVSYESVTSKINKFAQVLLAALVAGIILATMLSSRLQRIITRPLLDIIDVTNRITASQNYSLRIAADGSDELGVLAKSFNAMLGVVVAKDSELKKINEALESKVQERTKDLEEAVLKRFRAEEAIRKKHQQLLGMISSAPTAMAMLDDDLRYLVCSTQWVSDYKINQAVQGQDHRALIEHAPARWEAAYVKALMGEATSVNEDSFSNHHGDTVYLKWTIQPWWTEEMEVGGIIITSQNITDLIEARDSALKTAAIKSQFLANVSHELRTPLNGIIGFSTLLKDLPSSVEQLEYVDLIRGSGEQLLRVVNDVLDLSKLEKEAVQLEELSFDVNHLAHTLYNSFRLSAKQKGLLFTVETNNIAFDKVLGDEYRINQVLTNLIGNAIKFTEKGEIKLIIETAKKNPQQLLFKVMDTGFGIPEDKYEEIFKPFSQVDGSVTRKFGGTGLGLSIASNLVTLMGGTLAVDSQVGHGSTFYFTIPLEKDVMAFSIENQISALGVSVTDSHPRLLVAEDNVVNQKLVKAMLTKAGYDVTLVENGQIAVDEYQKSTFDLVILDLQMPIMGGIEAAQAIRSLSDRRGDKIPILALTAHAFEDDKERCFQAGMNGYLTKPIQREQLLTTISEIVHQAVK